jgi:serine/threonine-protein kinase
MVGEFIRGYRLVAALGTGAMGIVYLGEHKNIGKKAAIKLLRPELSLSPEAVSRFFDEARAAALVDHPGVAQVFDCDVLPANGQAFIIMEYLEGESLRHRLQREEPLALSECLRLAHDVADVLRVVHQAGIVHRDLKPDNIFLWSRTSGSRPEIKILDFGVAKLGVGLNRRNPGTLEGSLLGTPAYMSPEQCRGVANIDAQTDVYALGCILFELLARRPPFVGDTIGRLMSAHLTEVPPSLASLGCKVPSALEQLVARALAKLPQHRPVISEMLEVLKTHGNWAAQQDADGTLKPVSLAPPERAAFKPTSVLAREGASPAARSPNDAGALGPPTITIGGDHVNVMAAPIPRQSRRVPLIAATAAGLIAVVAAAIVLRPKQTEKPPPDLDPISSSRSTALPAPHPAPAATATDETTHGNEPAREVSTHEAVVESPPAASAAPSSLPSALVPVPLSSARDTLAPSQGRTPGPPPDRSRVTKTPQPSLYSPGSGRLPID